MSAFEASSAGLRRDGAALVIGDLHIDLDSMRVQAGHDVPSLTAQEFQLLVLLARQAGKPVSQDDLAEEMWGEGAEEHRQHLSVLVSRLRTKLATSRLCRVMVVRKRGYSLMPAGANRIEEIKLAKDGLDVIDDILRYALTGAEIDSDDIERMKWYGVFYRRQTPGYFTLRLRVPNGILSSRQIAEVGALSNDYGRGEVDITTRQNFQVRWLRIKDIPAALQRLDAVGLEYRQSGMDNVRNITGCPVAGVDREELIDASPITRAVQEAIVGRREFSNLPRKFNISISGCRHDCATSQIHDLSLTPAIRGGVQGFNVMAGGAMGGQRPGFAFDLDMFVAPDGAAALCLAVVELFRDEGPRENRQHSRLRWLIEEWGLERFRAEIEHRAGPLKRAGESQVQSFSGDHVGITPQKGRDLYTVGCLVPVGRIRGDDLIEFGRLAEELGDDELRLTNNQNLLIPNVPAAKLASLLAEPLLTRYSFQPSSWMRRTVSCTGRDFCSFALIDTKGSALAFAEHMQALDPTQAPLRVHWSGCAHGCGHHQVGEIGFQATKTVRDGRSVDAVDVFLGGRLGIEPRLAEQVLDAVPLTELPERLAVVLASRKTPSQT